ncbi:MAG: hypothetical protein O7G88_15205 [bacterium]|nr:hypothetical protein [bacterium]
MQTLLWLEAQCAQTDAGWRQFKYGLAEALYRDKKMRRENSLHQISLRLDQAGFDEAFRSGLAPGHIDLDLAGGVLDEETEYVMQAAIRFHCGGGCYNVGYVDLPLRNIDLLVMLKQIAATQGDDTPITIWNPSNQDRMVDGKFDAARHAASMKSGRIPISLYIDVWTKLRAILKSGKEPRDQVLKRLGGADRAGFFASYGIDVQERDQERLVFAALRRFCPSKRGVCNSRICLSHAMMPTDFVGLMSATLKRSTMVDV